MSASGRKRTSLFGEDIRYATCSSVGSTSISTVMHALKLAAAIAICLAACGKTDALEAKPADKTSRSNGNAHLMMPVARAAHAAAALDDGRVALIGGCVRESCEAGPDSSTVDVFDPRTRTFQRGGVLLSPRTSTTVARLPGGQVFIAGGWSGSAVTRSTEIFDAAAGRSEPGPHLSTPRADIAVALLPGRRVLLAGGYDGQHAANDLEIFDPATRSIRHIGRLRIARTGSGAALLPDGRVLVVGGGVNGPDGLRATATAEIVDPDSGASQLTGSLREARYKHAVIVLRSGHVLAIGGSDERDSRGKRNTVERFDPTRARFVPAGRMQAARYKIGSSVVLRRDGRVLIAGGAPQAEIYDPATARTSTVSPNFGGSLNFTTATLLENGSVLVAGGYYEDGIRMSAKAWLLR